MHPIEVRAAVTERINEAGLNAEVLHRGLMCMDEEDGVQAVRQLLRMIESMRCALEMQGIEAPEIIFVEPEDE